jgi:hypothetical protein
MLREMLANCDHTPKEPMVMKVSAMAAGLAATLVVGVAVTGCGSNKSSSPSSTTSSSTSTSSASPSSTAPTSSSGAAQPSDYTNLLIKATDIVVPGDTLTLAQTLPQAGTPGVSGLFMNQSGSRKVKDDIYIYPDAGTAAKARDAVVQILTDPEMGVKGGTPTPVDVGTGGTMAVGTKSDGSASIAKIFFTEGKVTVAIDFESPLSDPLQQDFVLDIARKQDAAIKAGLPA